VVLCKGSWPSRRGRGGGGVGDIGRSTVFDSSELVPMGSKRFARQGTECVHELRTQPLAIKSHFAFEGVPASKSKPRSTGRNSRKRWTKEPRCSPLLITSCAPAHVTITAANKEAHEVQVQTQSPIPGPRTLPKPDFGPGVQSPIRVGLRSPSPNPKPDSILVSSEATKRR
jgi:hypothetical protein